MTLAALLFAASARADATSDARELYDRAVHAYNMLHWDDALEDFQAAYAALPDPTLLFNIGQCQRQLGQYAAAAHSYRAYLAQAPDGGDRAAAERLAAQMDAEATRQRAPEPPAAPAVSPSAVVVAAPLAAPALRRRRLAAGLGVAGAGLALAITGAAMLGVGASDDASARRASTLPEQRQLWDQGGALQIAGIVTLAASGIGLGVGGLLLARRR